MSDDRFNVIVHHGGEVEAHEEAAEVEIGDVSGLNSDVEVEGEIEVDGCFYSCLKACKDSFVFCRPIIGLDGCFLKGKYGGELLSAVGRDVNDQLLPLAYAVVEVENKET